VDRKLGEKWFIRAMALAAISVGIALSGCSDETFRANGTTDVFVQDANPELLDILWVLDDRSPMFNARANVLAEASTFFQRLDAATATYRMGVVTADMQFAMGRLQPVGAPLLLEKGRRDEAAQRENRLVLFQRLLSQIINLRTGAHVRAFEAAKTALTTEFQPRADVPLVLVFLSDSDDDSSLDAGQTDRVAQYGDFFASLKSDKPDLLRVYSINYEALPSNASWPEREAKRCATFYNADIDMPGFRDDFFRLARRFTRPDIRSVTADLCGPFAGNIDLNGLRLLVPKTEFPLTRLPMLSTLKVRVIGRDGSEVNPGRWTYDSDRNVIVFEVAPPELAQVLVSYFAG
jgi:hypothetical protein